MLVLALTAWLVPRRELAAPPDLLLIVDPCADLREWERGAPVAAWLGAHMGRSLRAVAATPAAAGDLLRKGEAALVVCPDRVGLALDSSLYAPLAVGRRRAPHNLRPRSVRVSRRGAPGAARPWSEAPTRTMLGDSLSLAGLFPLCTEALVADGSVAAPGAWAARGLRFGPDPYDHGPVLHALRMGAADHAVVREWTARRFVAMGLLDAAAWEVAPISEPLPDVMVLGARRWPAVDLLRARELLVGLGRHAAVEDRAAEQAVRLELAPLGLHGFNLLLEPEYELLRRQYQACWPGSGL